jgi:hypothetical protein
VNIVESIQKKQMAIWKLVVVAFVAGLLITCASIIVGKKTYFSPCDYSGRHLHTVDRGAPLVYFRVTPSESTCDAVDNVDAVWASDVGNDVSFKALVADIVIWTALEGAILFGIRKLRSNKS